MSEITKEHIDEGIYSRYEYRNSKGYAHRLDGPAIEYDDGDYIWLVNGKRHRLDGPAIMLYSFNLLEWYIDGRKYLFDEWCSNLNKSPEEIVFLKLKYNIFS